MLSKRRIKIHYLLYESWMVLHLNKLEYPSPKDALWQVWLKLVQWFLRRFLNFVNVFSLFHNYVSLEKGGALHLNKLESPSPKDALCQVWLKLVRWFLRRRWKCEKYTTTMSTAMQTTSTTTTILTTDNGQIASLRLRWAKKIARSSKGHQCISMLRFWTHSFICIV